MTAPYDGFPESWEPYAPTPEPVREHVEIRAFGSDRCICPACSERPRHPDDLAVRRAIARSSEQIAAQIADAARRTVPVQTGYFLPRYDEPKPPRPRGDDPRAGLPIPPVWHPDGTVTLWHPSSPGVRLRLRPRLVRRLLHAVGRTTSPFATRGEIARERRRRRATTPRPRYDDHGLLRAICQQCDDRSHPSARNTTTAWIDGHRLLTGHTRITTHVVHPLSGPGGGSPRIPTTKGRR